MGTPIDGALKRVLECLEVAKSRGATKLQILAGQPPRMRVNGELSEPLQPDPFHFNETQAVVESLLSAAELEVLDKDGSVEVSAPVEWGTGGLISVFFGNGCHNFIVHLK